MDNIRIVMAGNPNVGKSSLFNLFTGSRQHTGNWPGKTVGSASAAAIYEGRNIYITDTPGTYSLNAISVDEENARDTILFDESDCIIVVCDACCPERSLFLALQIMEAKDNVVICFNLMDEAQRKGNIIDIPLLQKRLGCPVVGVSAAKKDNLPQLISAAADRHRLSKISLLPLPLAEALQPLSDYFDAYRSPLPGIWLACQVIIGDKSMLSSLNVHLGLDIKDPELEEIICDAKRRLALAGLHPEELGEYLDIKLKEKAIGLCSGAVLCSAAVSNQKKDLLCRPLYAWLSMLFFLFFILWLSIFAAEYPGRLLSAVLTHIGTWLKNLMDLLYLPPKLSSLLIDGVYETLATVISVMLPPMAVFFPLFNLLEDWGFLPRLAFNMDGYFKKCGGCGKQALTMCLGLGCNTVGINGCRIIGSPKEKLIAVLTNSFMPCNGRFPILISISSYMFRNAAPPWGSVYAALTVMGLIILGAISSFAASGLLSASLLKGKTSAFIFEIPPLRKPQILRVLKNAFVEKTLFVLLRALKFAAPAGMVIWFLVNSQVNGKSILLIVSHLLDPAAGIMGLDGAILLAFILALPASEIVLPVILMCYLSEGSITHTGTEQLALVLSQNGWDMTKSLCMMIFTLLHWPCVSSLAAIHDECGKWRYVFIGAVLPTLFGAVLCCLINLI